MSSFRIEPLGDRDRKSFDSGSDALNRYFRDQVGQDIRRRVASCFVAIETSGDIAGFYTLAASSLAFDALPVAHSKKLPRYPVIPAVLLGRLAVSRTHQGKGLGAALLADALLRVAQNDIAAYAMIVDAIDDDAMSFYEHFGFVRLEAPMRLIYPLANLKA
ncbi:MAG: GNAT family N-acetyltransferase [Alphaproteobacteria bacterium]|nr:GNAT family N-acetyltransferase [Alphaproteobacteria bacterium]